MSMPFYLSKTDPKKRFFPYAWKTAYWRQNGGFSNEGYLCPGCGDRFKGSKGFSKLQADHIRAFAAGGLTVWENLQLLCEICNPKKSWY